MHTAAIETADLSRSYRASRRRAKNVGPTGQLQALDRVSLEVKRGELFGLLGANGAGKTTLIKILTTLLAPTSGSAWVDGFDVVTEAAKIRPRINMVSGGESCGYGVLTVLENLWLFTQLYGVPGPIARQRIDYLLGVVGMTERASSKVSHLSTGLRQKMNFCRGFVTDPAVLFLDEPTLGLDVTAARAIRLFLRAWMAERPERTLLLTTHYMREADELCDRVAIIDGGKVLACDAPAALKKRVQKYSLFEIDFTPGESGSDWQEVARLPGVQQCTWEAAPTAVALKLALVEQSVVGAVVQRLLAGDARILALRNVEPTLEDVFIELVGHGLADTGLETEELAVTAPGETAPAEPEEAVQP